ncbi:GntR family transcriptional regulator [Vibrio brasiliensis]|nr:GntR family transcriptional regulator [Vibrio brasiliensis]MCG9752178.1 GntR family transcriptional regulator [Vibrio brasiliensis]MCG9781741.1 GntR family transcriptional regulator [Vibrio brasiliensis]
MSQKPVFKTRTQLVEEAIRTKILKGELKTGQPLRQDALAKEFNVSRIPVREALMQLEAQGLVSFEAHKGATVTELSPDKIDELFELRAVVECHILERAIQNMTDEDLARANEIRERFDEVVNRGDQVEEWSNYNYELHKALYAPANMPETMDVIYNLNTKCDRYIRMQLLFTEGTAKADNEHKALVEMCQNRDIDGAKYMLKKHILEAGAAIRDLLLERNNTQSGK